MSDAITKRYFTAEDYKNGLCDANGIALPGGPQEPPKRDIPDSKPTQAQIDLSVPRHPGADQPAAEFKQPETTTSSDAEGVTVTADAAPLQDMAAPIQNTIRGNEAVDPMSLNPKPAETGLNMPDDPEDPIVPGPAAA